MDIQTLKIVPEVFILMGIIIKITFVTTILFFKALSLSIHHC